MARESESFSLENGKIPRPHTAKYYDVVGLLAAKDKENSVLE